jgi:beta-N-acetylhexosaminidase
MSRRVIDEVIRGHIGFDGVLLSDDIVMGALSGRLEERVENALHAGCDLVIHCSGVFDEMAQIAEMARPISAETAARVARGEAVRLGSRREFDRTAAEARFNVLTGAVAR